MKHIFFVVGLIFVCNTFLFAQNTFEFQRYNSSRTTTLKTGKEITVTFKPIVENGKTDTVSKSVIGLLSSTTNSQLHMLATTEYAKYVFSQDSILETYRKYSYDYPVSYDANTIAYISYAPKV